MTYVLVSVFCSILVAVLIKLGRQKNIDVQQLVLWNYPVAVLLTFLLLRPALGSVSWDTLPFKFYIPLVVLLPTLFIFIALAIKHSGIVKTDVAQRMSLFIPLLASFFVFGESLELNKGIGIGIGLIAVVCSISWHKERESASISKNSIYPLVVFFGMGIIDILFKQLALHKMIAYTSSMFIVFVGAMLVSFGILLWKVYISKHNFDKRAVFFGSILGCFNFGNIFFYMKAHQALPNNPSIVFTSMNIGVIVLGSLVGVLFFKEKLSNINLIGLILAVISILLISYL